MPGALAWQTSNAPTTAYLCRTWTTSTTNPLVSAAVKVNVDYRVGQQLSNDAFTQLRVIDSLYVLTAGGNTGIHMGLAPTLDRGSTNGVQAQFIFGNENSAVSNNYWNYSTNSTAIDNGLNAVIYAGLTLQGTLGTAWVANASGAWQTGASLWSADQNETFSTTNWVHYVCIRAGDASDSAPGEVVSKWWWERMRFGDTRLPAQ